MASCVALYSTWVGVTCRKRRKDFSVLRLIENRCYICTALGIWSARAYIVYIRTLRLREGRNRDAFRTRAEVFAKFSRWVLISNPRLRHKLLLTTASSQTVLRALPPAHFPSSPAEPSSNKSTLFTSSSTSLDNHSYYVQYTHGLMESTEIASDLVALWRICCRGGLCGEWQPFFTT